MTSHWHITTKRKHSRQSLPRRRNGSVSYGCALAQDCVITTGVHTGFRPVRLGRSFSVTVCTINTGNRFPSDIGRISCSSSIYTDIVHLPNLQMCSYSFVCAMLDLSLTNNNIYTAPARSDEYSCVGLRYRQSALLLAKYNNKASRRYKF